MVVGAAPIDDVQVERRARRPVQRRRYSPDQDVLDARSLEDPEPCLEIGHPSSSDCPARRSSSTNVWNCISVSRPFLDRALEALDDQRHVDIARVEVDDVVDRRAALPLMTRGRAAPG
jgi:hypothetical protein